MNFPTFPKRQVLTLPFGYRVRIKVVSRREMKHRYAKGLWFDEGIGGKILIADDQPYDEKLDTLGHELDHALTDYRGWLRLMLENPFRAEQVLMLAQDIAEADE